MVLWAPVKVQHMTHLNRPALTCTEDKIKANCPVVRKLDITWDHNQTTLVLFTSFVMTSFLSFLPQLIGFHPPKLQRFDPLILQPNFNLKLFPVENDGQLLIMVTNVAECVHKALFDSRRGIDSELSGGLWNQAWSIMFLASAMSCWGWWKQLQQHPVCVFFVLFVIVKSDWGHAERQSSTGSQAVIHWMLWFS